MAIAIATSPAAVTNNGNATTASFSPGANTLLVAMVAASADNAAPTVSGGGLTWTRRVQRHPDAFAYVEIWTAPCAAGASNITVTGTVDSSFPFCALKVDVVTGASLSTPAGNTGNNTTTTNNATVNGYTSSQAGSRGWCVALDYGQNTAPTSTDDETSWGGGGVGMAGMSIRKAANTATSGETVTFNLDSAAAGAVDWHWAALEIKPASVDASATPDTVDAVADVPAPGLHAAATARPVPVDALADIPLPALHAGATVRPATVDATASVPAPSVVAGSAELVEPVTVTASADVPAPVVSAIQNAAISVGSVDAAADIPAPAVTATRQSLISPVPVDAQAAIPTPGVSVPVLPGERITGDFQIEWAGTLFGGFGNVYQVLAGSVTGWDDLPGLDSDSAIKPSRHGAWPGRSLAQQREVSAIVAVDDPATFMASMRTLRRITAPADDDSEYALVIRTYGEALLAYGSISARAIPIENYQQGWAQVSLRWMCADPRRFSLTQNSVVIAANGSQTLLNEGDTATSARLRIPGPATNPVVLNETTDRILGFDVTLSSGELLEVDIQLGTVTIGSASYMSTLSSESVPVEDFVLAPGENLVTYETDSGGTAGAEILWRSASI